MAKKKKAKNKKKLHRSQAARPAATGSGEAVGPTATQVGLPSAPVLRPSTATIPGVSGTPAARWSYMGGDVRRIGMFASICILAELVLWYAFSYTGLGS